ncbi:MarR family winged helix-turn-helix transcriptional regulator [Saccharothrix obliqua]|uniref:MarR family winged helix-turn-helix transcriptional regulator n=1 Tax=Saccharothrix obliqua TaxID=2861747 RepID=UPI001C607A05|nr:MarR family transcriptional regulator [Saccharothrix obliqua]MBW4720319.1 MarR family transcriptional regulator [Saccharothrix obliqua]
MTDDTLLWRRLSALTARVNQALDKRLARTHDVTLSELFTLLALRDGDPRGMRVHELTSVLGLEQSSVSRLTARLEGKGLVGRVRCDFDRRGVYCAITDAGRALADEADGVCGAELGAQLDQAAFEERSAAVVARLRYAGPVEGR